MFWVYVVLIAAGLSYSISIALRHG